MPILFGRDEPNALYMGALTWAFGNNFTDLQKFFEKYKKDRLIIDFFNNIEEFSSRYNGSITWTYVKDDNYTLEDIILNKFLNDIHRKLFGLCNLSAPLFIMRDGFWYQYSQKTDWMLERCSS